jgi:alpha-1,3-rhamnosyl/mannosyltransferase
MGPATALADPARLVTAAEREAGALRVGLEAADALAGHRAIGRYARELPLALLRAALPGEIDLRLLLFGRRCRARAEAFLASLGRAGRARVRALPFPGKLLHAIWNRFECPRVERILGPLDVVHALGFLTPPAGPAARTILTMHGIVNFVRPDLLRPRFVRELEKLWRVYLRRADWMVSVSETARREFLDRFDFPPQRIRAIPLGVSGGFRPRDPGALERPLAERFGPLGVRRPYLLFVGGLERVKNLAGLLEAFSRLVGERRVPHQLVLAGEPANAEEEVRAALGRREIANRVVFTGHLSQVGEDLPLLYCGADLLVQPSFYEGWASPPLEAMASGTPVVASSAASLPETCGDAALYAPPEDPGALAAAIERALLDRGLHDDLARRGLAWSARWTWERCARATLALYRDAADAEPRPLPRAVRRR